MSLKNKHTVSLEDLLKVKRAERPPAEFWAEFEREMRVKQLAAIVEPRPWWAPFIRAGARISRYQLPLGAAAVLALSLVSVNEYRTGPGERFAPASKVRATMPDPALPAPVVDETALAGSEMAAPAQVNLAAMEVTPAADAALETAPTGKVSHVVELDQTELIDEMPSPSARYIAANLAALQADNPAMIDEAFGASIVRSEREPTRDPLAQMSSPRDSRRSRLLATALPAVSVSDEVEVGNSQRVARYLTEERLYDSISRVGVRMRIVSLTTSGETVGNAAMLADW